MLLFKLALILYNGSASFALLLALYSMLFMQYVLNTVEDIMKELNAQKEKMCNASTQLPCKQIFLA